MLAHLQFSGFIGTAGIDRDRHPYFLSIGICPAPANAGAIGNYFHGLNGADQDGMID